MRARKELTVELAVDGDELVRKYYRATYDQTGDEVRLRTDAVGRDFTHGTSHGLTALAELLERGEPAALRSHFTEKRLAAAGGMLFDALFTAAGDDKRDQRNWQRVLLPVFDEPRGSVATPTRYGVRLRVWTADPMLTCLPWRLTSYDGWRLIDSDWTFEVCPERDRPPRVELPSPAKVLIVAPRHRGMTEIGTAAHVAELKEAFEDVWPGYERGLVEVVETRARLADMLAGMRPHILYYYGHGTVRGGQLCLLLGGPSDDPQPLLMSDLARMIEGEELKLAYLNGCKTAVSGWHGAGHQLASKVPVVLANVTTAWSTPARDAALSLLRDVLGPDEDDPVAAVCRLKPETSTRGYTWATLISHTHYLRWRTAPFVRARRHPLGAYMMDRDDQRALVKRHVSQLAQSDRLRVATLFAYATPGNALAKLSEQLLHEVEGHPREVKVTPLTPFQRPLPFPRRRADLPAELEAGVRAALRAGQDTRLEYVLGAHIRDGGASDLMPVLWITWETLPADAELDHDHLRAWLEFAANVLTAECPRQARIVACLTKEYREDQIAELGDRLKQYKWDLHHEANDLLALPPVGSVGPNDVWNYLDRPESGCPSAIAREVAGMIHKATGGGYDPAVQLIEEGQATSFHGLRDRLRQEVEQ